MHSKSKLSGFTLIELVIVVAIIAILAAIAYPTYRDSVRKSRRADAKSVLLQAAQWMERFYTENNAYDKNRGGTAVALPAGLSKSPIDGTKYYNIALTACGGATTVTASSFTLSAKPIMGTDQASDRCGGLTLTNTGARGTCVASPPPTVDECWR